MSDVSLTEELEKAKNEIYIHYGHKHFDRQSFEKIKNRPMFNKPLGGLWASPVNADFGWKDWNETERFIECNDENSFSFKISDSAKIFTIKTEDDLNFLKKNFSTPETKMFSIIFPDFEAMARQFDAVSFYRNRTTYYELYGWDCDSILILNPDIVQEINKEKSIADAVLDENVEDTTLDESFEKAESNDKKENFEKGEKENERD